MLKSSDNLADSVNSLTRAMRDLSQSQREAITAMRGFGKHIHWQGDWTPPRTGAFFDFDILFKVYCPNCESFGVESELHTPYLNVSGPWQCDSCGESYETKPQVKHELSSFKHR